MGGGRGNATDEMLMVRYQRGDRDAFAEIVQRYKRPIYNFVYRQVRNPETAEDVTQDAFLRVVQNAGEFKHEARFSTWLYTIARNLCVDHLRKAKHRRHPSLDQPAGGQSEGRPLGESMPDPHHSSSVERTASGNQMRDHIVAAVDALPDDQREVFLLREVGNLPFKEIAEVVGVGENTVKSRMRYALERLKQALSEFEEYARALR
ncbi:MAG TPA: RNA polymerase sigma factor [Polyangiaceae bacterium]|nr:RNA polymerase sigma factor [Polyangiaceae bacterium]